MKMLQELQFGGMLMKGKCSNFAGTPQNHARLNALGDPAVIVYGDGGGGEEGRDGDVWCL